jgi:hypothetical protein
MWNQKNERSNLLLPVDDGDVSGGGNGDKKR